MLVLVNKWDLVEKDHKSVKEFEKVIRNKWNLLQMFQLFLYQLLTKQRIFKAIETAVEVYKNRNKKIKTSKLNEVMLPIIENYPPPAYKGKVCQN